MTLLDLARMPVSSFERREKEYVEENTHWSYGSGLSPDLDTSQLGRVRYRGG